MPSHIYSVLYASLSKMYKIIYIQAQMFKNLKNRLDNEAGKLKQSAQQYTEQIAAQVGQYRQAMVIMISILPFNRIL